MAWKCDKELELISTEYRILRLLLAHPGQMFSIQNIYESVWEEPFFSTDSNTVMVFIRKLREKIEDHPRHPIRLVTVWGRGIVLNRKFKKISQKLGVKLFVVAVFALACAWLGHYLLSDVVVEWFFYDPRFDTYWESKSDVAVQSFQMYVTDHNLSTRDALTDTVWNKQNSNIILFTEPAFLYEEKKASSDFNDVDKYEAIYCSDGFIYATSYLPGNTYFFW